MIMEGRDSKWTLCGTQVSRTALVFLCQVIILYISIIICFVNLTIGNGPDELWISVLSLSISTILPSPKVCKTPRSISSPFSQHITHTVYSVRGESWPRAKKRKPCGQDVSRGPPISPRIPSPRSITSITSTLIPDTPLVSRVLINFSKKFPLSPLLANLADDICAAQAI